ncbi:MAG: putative DNA binding domain-containing protein [Bacteroidales bacterium]|nr:putative DNA binding domain-containing protein [Bacteroidales bacterium]
MSKDKEYTALLTKQIAVIGKEVRSLEFKSNYQDADRLGKYISALSNGACLDNEDYGYLYFGVEDETLKLLGTAFDVSRIKAKGNQNLEIFLRQYITPKIDFKIEEFHDESGKRYVVFIIPAAKGEPTCFMNIPYVRIDSSVSDLRPYTEWMRSIYNSQKDWTAEVIEDATMDDLDKDAIAKAREGYKQRFPNLAKECDGWDDKVFMDKACLTIGGKITRATLLLVGKETSAYKLNHIAQIVWKCFQDGQVFGDIYTIPFIRTTSELLGRIRNYRFKIYPKTSLIPAEVWKYDTESILEGMHNSIAHQNYEVGARIIVTERQDSLIFQNDGNFYDGDYKQYITGEKTPKSYRNPALVKAMVNIKMIDTQGYGIHKMFQSQKNRYLPMPDYDLSTSNVVILNLPGAIIDENYSLMLLANQDLTLTDAVLLDQVQKGHPIASEAIAMLRKRKLIEGRIPHIYVSKNIAQATDQKVEYSKHKGLADKKCEALLLDSLKDHGSLSKQEIERLLWDLLSDQLDEKQKKTKVYNILRKLRESGQIINETKGNKSLWFLVKS